MMLGYCLVAQSYAIDIQPEETYTWQASHASTEASHAMVVTANPVATDVGYTVLKQGGNAIDAAIAIQLMLNLVEPQSSGIGGGAFMLYWDASTQKLTSYDGRSAAPMAAPPTYFLDAEGKPKPFWSIVSGGGSVAVPGVLRLLEMAYQEHGSLPWAHLFTPTIEKAKEGFILSPRMAASIAAHADDSRQLDRFPAARDYFFTADGNPKPAGTLLTNPAFAHTLEMIAHHGVEAFYTGSFAKKIVEATQQPADNRGLLTMDDLARYRAKKRPVVCSDYRAYQICGMGPPSSGGITVGQILGIMNQQPIPQAPDDIHTLHRYIESSKLAFADRNQYIADSDFVMVPTKGLLDPNYMRDRSMLIRDTSSMLQAEPGHPPGSLLTMQAPHNGPELTGTTHFVIRDAYGNAVSMTSSIETGFGSRIMVGGFLLNNDLTDFSRQPSIEGKPVANRIEGGKRPRSSMAPTIVMKAEQPYILLGSPGGSRIIPYVASTLMEILDWGMDPQSAINTGHIVNLNGPTELEEHTNAVQFAAPLQALGHHTYNTNLNSGLHVIMIEPHRLIGAVDYRREGSAKGY